MDLLKELQYFEKLPSLNVEKIRGFGNSIVKNRSSIILVRVFLPENPEGGTWVDKNERGTSFSDPINT